MERWVVLHEGWEHEFPSPCGEKVGINRSVTKAYKGR